MMRTLIITVAGTATRFNKDTDKETLKCLFYKDSPKLSLLYLLLEKSHEIDKIIIVGGYLFEDLLLFVKENLSKYREKIDVVYNEHFNDYGSGYSLIKGILALDDDNNEVIFAEGDLFMDMESFSLIIHSKKDVITINREFISSEKSVVLYVNHKNEVKYLYDTSHKFIQINEPLTFIYNSGQVWKFNSVHKLKQIPLSLTDNQLKGTNLEIIQKYFLDIPFSELEIVPFKEWHNCNTIADYMKLYNILKNEGNRY